MFSGYGLYAFEVRTLLKSLVMAVAQGAAFTALDV